MHNLTYQFVPPIEHPPRPLLGPFEQVLPPAPRPRGRGKSRWPKLFTLSA